MKNESPLNPEIILGYRLIASDISCVVGEIAAHLKESSRTKWLACMNPHSYVCATRDPNFSTALQSADFLIPDGVGIVMASRWLGGSIRKRITGPEIFDSVNLYLQQTGGRSVFFLGSTEDCLKDIKAKFERDYPAVRVAGTLSPPFKSSWTENELESMIRAINEASPDVLWVGMTAPKQEKWIYDNISRTNVRFAAAIGAAFDFYTGRIKRTSPFFQRIGLEWLPRLAREPKRLWRRTFVSAPIFAWHVLKSTPIIFTK